jgi:hypothetical protein
MNSNNNQLPETVFDRISRDVVCGGGIGDEQADGIAASPFFYARLRARIDADKSPQPSGWLASLTLAWRTIPALALVAMIAVGLFLFAGSKPSVIVPPPVIPVQVSTGLAPATACSLSSSDGCAVSENDALATLFAEQGGKPQP